MLLVEVTWLATCVGRPVAETDDELMELQFSEAKATLEEGKLGAWGGETPVRRLGGGEALVLVVLASCNGRYGVQPLLRRPGEIGGERSTGVLVRRAWGCDCRRLYRQWWRKLPRIVSGSRRSGMWGGCWGDGTRFWSWRWPIRLNVGGDWGRLARRARGCGGVGEGGRAVWLSRVEAGCGCVRGGG